MKSHKIATRAGSLLLVTALLLTLPASGVGSAPAAPAVPKRVIIISVPRLTWDQITPETTPNLYRFFRHSAVGDLSLRTISPRTSISEGYLSIGTGNRVSAARSGALTTRSGAWARWESSTKP